MTIDSTQLSQFLYLIDNPERVSYVCSELNVLFCNSLGFSNDVLVARVSGSLAYVTANIYKTHKTYLISKSSSYGITLTNIDDSTDYYTLVADSLTASLYFINTATTSNAYDNITDAYQALETSVRSDGNYYLTQRLSSTSWASVWETIYNTVKTASDSSWEKFVTLNQLKAYDEKKGTAVIDTTDDAPSSPENRSYIVRKQTLIGLLAKKNVVDWDMLTDNGWTVVKNDEGSSDDYYVPENTLWKLSRVLTTGETMYEGYVTKVRGFSTNWATAYLSNGNTESWNISGSYEYNLYSEDRSVYVKDAEIAQKTDIDKLTDHYIQYVDSLPSTVDTDVIYGIDHTYEQSVSAQYLVQDFISTYMKKQSTNSWLLNDHVTSTYATITYDSTDYEFNKLYWTGKRYVPYTYDSSTGTSTRVGDFGIEVGDSYNYALTWNYEHKDYYVSESDSGSLVQLANMEQVEDWFLKKEELGKANGVAVLDGSGKIPKNELNFTALNFLGMTHEWPSDEDPEAGDFYIVDQEFTHTEDETTTILEPGDWIIYFTSWQVESNNVIVNSVNGKIGTVVLTGDDINVTYDGTTDTITNNMAKLGRVDTVNGVEPDDDKNVEIDGDNINVTYEGTTDTLNNTLTNVGKVKTVNDVEPDDDGNIDVNQLKDEKSEGYESIISVSGTTARISSETNGSNIRSSSVTANSSTVSITASSESDDSTITLSADSILANGKNIVTSINSVTAGTDGAVEIDGDDITVTYSSTEMTLNTALTKVGSGNVKTVCGYSPDSSGNVNVFPNGTWTLVGDDVYIGDYNVAGNLCIKAANTTTPGITFYNQSGTKVGVAAIATWDGSTLSLTV